MPPERKGPPPGRYFTNFAFICAPLAVVASPGLFGLIGLILAGLAIRRGDRRLGTYALIAVAVCATIPILVNLATTAPPVTGS